MSMSTKSLILAFLAEASNPLPVHAFPIPNASETAISARLRELRKEGKVESVPVPGRKYTAWKLSAAQQEFRL